MGSNLKALIVGGTFAAVMVGMTPAALADGLDGVLGHIDIPEIAGFGNGPKFPGFEGADDFIFDPDSNTTVSEHEFLLRRDWSHHELQGLEFGIVPSFGSGFETGFNANYSEAIAPSSLTNIPTPGAVSLGLIGAGLIGLRRRRA